MAVQLAAGLQPTDGQTCVCHSAVWLGRQVAQVASVQLTSKATCLLMMLRINHCLEPYNTQECQQQRNLCCSAQVAKSV